MATLLERTRKINKLLQKSESVEYDGISRVLSNVIGANVYITNKKGKIYGYAFVDDFECDLMIDKVINQGEFPKHYVNWLLKLDETSSNLRSKTGMCAFSDTDTKCMFNGKNTTIVPIYGVGERIGTLIVAKFDEEFTDDDLLLAHMDAKLVVQVLINLVDNAIKYTPAGSHIVLSAAAQGESAVIRVSDDGPGIPDEAKEKVFEMFSTGEKRISDSRRSLGLGLALCRTIIAAHGGTITLSDNKPHGCIFTFTLPLGEVSLHE